MNFKDNEQANITQLNFKHYPEGRREEVYSYPEGRGHDEGGHSFYPEPRNEDRNSYGRNNYEETRRGDGRNNPERSGPPERRVRSSRGCSAPLRARGSVPHGESSTRKNHYSRGGDKPRANANADPWAALLDLGFSQEEVAEMRQARERLVRREARNGHHTGERQEVERRELGSSSSSRRGDRRSFPGGTAGDDYSGFDGGVSSVRSSRHVQNQFQTSDPASSTDSVPFGEGWHFGQQETNSTSNSEQQRKPAGGYREIRSGSGREQKGIPSPPGAPRAGFRNTKGGRARSRGALELNRPRSPKGGIAAVTARASRGRLSSRLEASSSRFVEDTVSSEVSSHVSGMY